MQGLLEYSNIALDIARNEVDKKPICTDLIGDYDKMWGSHKLLYHVILAL